MMRLLVAGGGTAGHVHPAVAVIEELRRRYGDAQIGYVGSRTGIERQIVARLDGVRYYPILARGTGNGSLLARLAAAVVLLAGMVQALVVFARFRPRVVFGTGGYASAAPVLLGALLGRFLPLRTVIHEQNVVPGLANRLLGRVVDTVLVSFRETTAHFAASRRVVITGNPVRAQLGSARRDRSTYRSLGLDPDKRTVLVFGGSKGSHALVAAAVRAAKEGGGLQVLLLTGERVDARRLEDALRRAGVENLVAWTYLERMDRAFAVADLVVCRAGATTLAELATCGKPAVLIPWRGAAGDHQMENALLMHHARACELAEEPAIRSGDLGVLVRQIVGDEGRLQQMSRSALTLGMRDAALLVLGELTTPAGGVRC